MTVTTFPLSTVALETPFKALAAKHFSFEQLALIYNEGRVDYIVPMPMNARRMEEYVRSYDVDLAASLVMKNGHDQTGGLGMLGLRQNRAWITRLGVAPASRGHKLGQYIMEQLLANAEFHGAQQAQLEVIEGNEPAYRLFLKLGFETVSRLLVIRRPPSMPEPLPADIVITPLDIEAITDKLSGREKPASWLNETPSLLNAGNLEGLSLTFADGTEGWIVFRNSLFQITHVILGAPDNRVASVLLHALHSYYPRHDTKIENLPADSTLWPVFQQWGYCEAFTRLEMVLSL